MAENSGIEWTHHTFNPWIGCTRISPACDRCYAATWAQRYGQVRWGDAPRHRTSAANWSQPVKWNRRAEAAGIRYRVFCASLADVFDNHGSITSGWRGDLWHLIHRTPHLDWLLLTKRPQNITKMLPEGYGAPAWGEGWPNVWLGITAENQEEFDRRWPHLAKIPAAVRFVSYEPALGRLSIVHPDVSPDWIIAGGESGSGFRAFDPDWIRDLRGECALLDIPFLFKQWSGPTQPAIKAQGRLLDGVLHDGYPIPRRIAKPAKENTSHDTP